MTIKYEMVFISPVGPIGIQCYGDKLSSLVINHKLKKTDSKNWLYREVGRQLDLYFQKKIFEFDIPFILEGTDYQKKVLNEVAKIKYGDKKTYSQIAKKVNSHPRPVGNACRKNPIQLIIPCHRVIGKNHLGGFAGGTQNMNKKMFLVKNSLLKLEVKKN
tara:strand:- start:423 stop:902 length:480 start_codon:yes stop_codon:yes gene_type:complete